MAFTPVFTEEFARLNAPRGIEEMRTLQNHKTAHPAQAEKLRGTDPA
jgi:hypothetical protein